MPLEITGANSCRFLSFGLDAIFLISPIYTGHMREQSSLPRASGPHRRGREGTVQEMLVQCPSPSQLECKPSKDFHCLSPVLQGSHCSLFELTKWQLIKIYQHFCFFCCAGVCKDFSPAWGKQLYAQVGWLSSKEQPELNNTLCPLLPNRLNLCSYLPQVKASPCLAFTLVLTQ